MDNLTHTLFAVTLGRTPLGRAGRGTTTALVLASNAPDVDIVTAARGGAAYLQWHRGPTHGPLGIVGLAAVTAAIVWAVQRYTDRRGVRPGEGPSATFPDALRRVRPRRAVPHPDGLPDVVRHAPSESVQLALVRRRPDADRRRVPGRSPVRRPPVRSGVGGVKAPQRGDCARADGGQLRGPRRRPARSHRPRAARVRPADAAAVRSRPHRSGRSWRDGRGNKSMSRRSPRYRAGPAGASRTWRPSRRFFRRSSGVWSHNCRTPTNCTTSTFSTPRGVALPRRERRRGA